MEDLIKLVDCLKSLGYDVDKLTFQQMVNLKVDAFKIFNNHLTKV